MGEALGVPEIVVRGWSAKAILVAPSRRREAEMLMRAAADLALEHNLTERAATVLGNLSDLAFGHDRYQDALGYLERELELARRTGDRPNEWFAISESTYALYHLGRWDEALAAFAELPVELLPSGHTLISPLTADPADPPVPGRARGGAGAVRHLRPPAGSIDVQERSCYAAGCGDARARGGPVRGGAARAPSNAVATQGLVGAWPQNVKLGLVAAVEAATRPRPPRQGGGAAPASSRRQPDRAAHAADGRARAPLPRAHGGIGRVGGGASSPRPSGILRDLGIPFWLAVTQLEHAESLLRTGGPGDAGALIADARATFERLRAAPWLERVEAVAAPALQADAAS